MPTPDAQNVLDIRSCLETGSISLRTISCDGACRHKSEVECAASTHLVFPYRGAFTRHVGNDNVLGTANHMLIFNQNEEYQISHPVGGGDDCLSIGIDPALLDELCPVDHLVKGRPAVFHGQSRVLDPQSQMLTAVLAHRLQRDCVDDLEAEILALALVRRAMGGSAAQPVRATYGRRMLVSRAKLILMEDVARRWTLAEIAGEVGISPVYLAQVFSQVEGVPLYQYHLRLRLAHALDVLPDSRDLTQLALELGFSSHSHFSHAFRKAYGKSPSEFQRLTGHSGSSAIGFAA